MTKVLFKLVIIFSLLAIIPISAKEIRITVDEKIGDDTRLRVISSEDEDVTVLITAKDLTPNKPLFNSVELFCYENGINCMFNSGNVFSQLSFIASPQSIDLLFNFIQEHQEPLQHSADIDVLILGNVNQQKMLGSLYSQWSKFKALNKNSSNLSSIQFSVDDLKDKKHYWTKVFAQLLLCESDEFYEREFLLNEEGLYCNYDSSAKILSPGNIANIKSNLYSKYLINRESNKSLLRLLQKFRVPNSLEAIDEFINLLPSLSIESIHNLYLEYFNSVPVTGLDSGHENPSSVTAAVDSKLIEVSSVDGPLWGVTLIMEEQLDVCQILNCSNLEQQLAIDYFYSDKTWMFLQFHRDDAEKQINVIAEQILKPLSITNVFSKLNSKVIVFANDDKSALSPLVKALDGTITSTSLGIIDPKRTENNNHFSKGCSETNAIGAPYWANEALLNYYYRYEEAKQASDEGFSEWRITDHFCKVAAKKSIIFDSETFELLKNALISSVKATESNNYIYRSFVLYYQLDIKSLLLKQLESLTFAEFQYYAKEIGVR